MSQKVEVFGFVYLQSPDGSVWKVTLDNAGQVISQKVGTVPSI